MDRIRFQTGEASEVVKVMKDGKIPKVDVDDNKDFEFFTGILEKYNIFIAEDVPFDRTVVDTVKEPDFEFRVGFYEKSNYEKSDCRKSDKAQNKGNIMFIDFYFEPYIFDDYDEISWG